MYDSSEYQFTKFYERKHLESFWNDEETKFWAIEDEEFLGLGLHGCMAYAGYYPNKQYNSVVGIMNTDFYVRQALKLYDATEYKRHIGYTRKAVYGLALNRLLHATRPIHSKKNILNDERAKSCYEAALREAEVYMFGGYEKRHPLRNFRDAMLALPTNTSAGLSYPGKTKGEVSTLAMAKAERMFRDISTRNGIRIDKRTDRPPCQIALRGHLSHRLENKSRAVIIYPYEVQLLEAKVFKEMYDCMKRHSTILQGKGSLHRLYCYMQDEPDKSFVNTDVKGWDVARFIFLMRDAFKILRNRLQLDNDHDKLFKWLVEYYINTPIALASGHRFIQIGGVPSGTYLTLIMNSLMNYVMQATLLKYHNVPYEQLQVVGDDAAFFVDTFFDFGDIMDKYIESAQHFFGSAISKEKSRVTREVHDRTFIGYKFKQMRLWRDTDEWFRSALYPERDVKNVAVSFSRMFSYYCIGGCNDEKFRLFFEFFLSVYQNHLRKYDKKVFQRRVFRFGSLRIFKDVLDFDEKEIINLNFDEFMLKIDFTAIPFMFSVGMSIRNDN